LGQELLEKATSSQETSVSLMLVNLSCALILGTLVATRPWRKLLGQSPALREMVHAQILIAVAGAIAVTVIGDSLARAFGLVGLGGFIRFRTGIRDPRDAAVFFLLIGLGMACGLGAYWAAGVSAIFVMVVLLVLDLKSEGKQSSFVRLTAVCTDPRGASASARQAIEQFPVKIRGTSLKIADKELRFDLENPNGVEAGPVIERILEETKGLVTAVEWESLDAPKGTTQ
jgi:hypothetical protein